MQELPKTGSAVGVDVGMKNVAILSTGEVFGNPKWFRILEKKLAHAQRILSHRTKGGANWHKRRIKVARIHERITNARTNYLQKLSTMIIKNNDVIGIEDLQVSNMLQDHKLAKAIQEVSWSQFRAIINFI